MEPIEVGPGLFFDNVLVPTSAEREGNFEAFLGPIVDPLSGHAFARNIIPMSRLGELFAFEIGPSAASVAAAPEPTTVGQLGIGFAAILLILFLKKFSNLNDLRLR